MTVTMGQGFALVCWSGIGEPAPNSLGPFYTCLQSASEGKGVMGLIYKNQDAIPRGAIGQQVESVALFVALFF